MRVADYTNGYTTTLSTIDNCLALLKKSNQKKTLEHAIEVSRAGMKIAHSYQLDKEKIELACYLHDISVLVPRSDYVELCEANSIEVLAVERELPLLLHQKVSRLIAEEVFSITDGEILSAIEFHTTLKGNPSKLDMAVFIADKLAWDQEGIPPFFNVVSEALETSLEKACFTYIDYCLKAEMILMPHPLLLAAKDDLQHKSI